jgi:xanthosine utilization system XapX-like protein
MSDSSGFDRSVAGSDTDGLVQPLVLIVLSVLGSYAIANAVDPMREYLSMTFDLAESSAGAWWLAQTILAEAPLLVLLLVAIATISAIRNGGLLLSCVLPTALLQGMAVAFFGLQSGLLEVAEPSLPVGIVTGAVGWMLGTGITMTTNRFSDHLGDGLLLVLFGRWNDQRRIATLLGSIVLLLLAGYAIASGARILPTYLERTVGLRQRSIQYFLEIYLVRAPLVVVFLLGVAAVNAVRGGGVVTSGGLPTALLLGMGFAVFGFPPKLLNVFYQAIPAGILLGVLGWLLGIGAVQIHRSRHSITP